jgi:hypothetical protein
MSARAEFDVKTHAQQHQITRPQTTIFSPQIWQVYLHGKAWMSMIIITRKFVGGDHGISFMRAEDSFYNCLPQVAQVRCKGLDNRFTPQADATARPIPKAKGARQKPQGFFFLTIHEMLDVHV